MNSMIALPAIYDPPARNHGAVHVWVKSTASQITVATLLNTHEPRTDILQELINRVRFVIRRTKMFKHHQLLEVNMRQDIYSFPNEFCFHVGEMRKYHQYHVAEMLQLLLKLMADQGVDATAKHVAPVPGGLQQSGSAEGQTNDRQD